LHEDAQVIITYVFILEPIVCRNHVTPSFVEVRQSPTLEFSQSLIVHRDADKEHSLLAPES